MQSNSSPNGVHFISTHSEALVAGCIMAASSERSPREYFSCFHILTMNNEHQKTRLFASS
jgi:hypothetical protein